MSLSRSATTLAPTARAVPAPRRPPIAGRGKAVPTTLPTLSRAVSELSIQVPVENVPEDSLSAISEQDEEAMSVVSALSTRRTRPSPSLSLKSLPQLPKKGRQGKPKVEDALITAMNSFVSAYNGKDFTATDTTSLVRLLIDNQARDKVLNAFSLANEGIAEVKDQMTGSKFTSLVVKEILPFLEHADFGCVYEPVKENRKTVWTQTDVRVIDRLPTLVNDHVSNKVILQGLMKIYLNTSVGRKQEATPGKVAATYYVASDDMKTHLADSMADKKEDSEKKPVPKKGLVAAAPTVKKEKKPFNASHIPANTAITLLNYYLLPANFLTDDDKSFIAECNVDVKKEMDFVAEQCRAHDALKKIKHN